MPSLTHPVDRSLPSTADRVFSALERHAVPTDERDRRSHALTSVAAGCVVAVLLACLCAPLLRRLNRGEPTDDIPTVVVFALLGMVALFGWHMTRLRGSDLIVSPLLRLICLVLRARVSLVPGCRAPCSISCARCGGRGSATERE